MAHPQAEAGAPSPFAVIGLRSMTPAERASGRFMRAPDHGDAPGLPSGDALEIDPVKRIQAALGDDGQGDDDDIAGDDDLPEDQSDEDRGDADPSDDASEGKDEPEIPAIDPPISWAADAKELFAQLPPEMQRTVAERESQREKVVQAKATEAAEARKGRALAEEAALKLHQQHAVTVEQIAQAFLPEKPDYSLLATDPQAYAYQMAAYEETAAQYQQLVQHAQSSFAAANQQDKAAKAQWLNEQNQVLAAALPEWANDETRGAIIQTVAATGKLLGYDDAVMNEAGANDILALKTASEWKAKADKYDALQAQKMAVVRQAKDLPRSNRPNAPQPAGSAQARATQQQRERLRTSGDVRDAASLIASRL